VPAAPDGDRERALGLGSSTGLVTGSIVGTGVFTMPRTSSILVPAVIAIGAILVVSRTG
jgi:basic amino acid/polyamine antiporter, APA family